VLRIKVTPESNYHLASRMKAASIELIESKQTIIRAARRLDWEISSWPTVENLINQASLKADRLADEAYNLSEYLNRAGKRFMEADSSFDFTYQSQLSSIVQRYDHLKRLERNGINLTQRQIVPHTSSLGWVKTLIT
jgi:hypothetical protein